MPPPLEVCDLNGVAVLWPYAGTKPNGEIVVTTPVEIPVRWTWRATASASGGGTFDATVVVAEDVAVDSLMWEGSLSDLTGTSSTGPTLVDDLSSIVRVASANYGRDFKYDPRNVRRELGVVYYRKRLTVVLPEE